MQTNGNNSLFGIDSRTKIENGGAVTTTYSIKTSPAMGTQLMGNLDHELHDRLLVTTNVAGVQNNFYYMCKIARGPKRIFSRDSLSLQVSFQEGVYVVPPSFALNSKFTRGEKVQCLALETMMNFVDKMFEDWNEKPSNYVDEKSYRCVAGIGSISVLNETFTVVNSVDAHDEYYGKDNKFVVIEAPGWPLMSVPAAFLSRQMELIPFID